MPNDVPRRSPDVRPARVAKRVRPREPSVDARALLSLFGAGRATIQYGAKRSIFRQGDPADAIYFIETGKIRLTVVSDQGREGVIAMLGPGEFFGEGCLAGQPIYLSTASTMAPSAVVKVERDRMVRMLAEERNLARLFIGHLLSRNIQFEADLVDQLFNSSEKRLARVLLLLANFGKEGKMEMVIPSIGQDVLAARVGTTRSRINFFMNKFRKLGFIEYNGSLKVHSALLNVIVHD